MASRLREFGETPPPVEGVRLYLTFEEIREIIHDMEYVGVKNAPYNLLVTVLKEAEDAKPRTF